MSVFAEGSLLPNTTSHTVSEVCRWISMVQLHTGTGDSAWHLPYWIALCFKHYERI